MAHSHFWWQTGVVYQIYPRSFLDNNGDGVGDLPGITSKLDYVHWLGVDAIWLSPIYPSPMADFGYDITNYTSVHPLFGTLEDLDTLLHQAHLRDLKLILDFVPNHTSDEHSWFQQSRSNRTNERRNWYIWRDPAPDGGPPNNWMSRFGGSAWQFDERTGQYYLHLYDVKQPDLNWRNPQVRQEMYNVMRFWLDRGIDGFRIDALEVLLKDEQFLDNPPNPLWKSGDPPNTRLLEHYVVDQPGMHAIMQEMRALTESYSQRVLIGELYLPLKRLMPYYGEQLDEIHLPFNFQFVNLPIWEARTIRQVVEDYEASLPAGAWPNWVLGNHDRSRIATRVGREQARLTQMLLLTLRGTPTCYYGDELGMQDVPLPRELMQDPAGKNHLEQSRDPIRTPMQWNGSVNAGFCPAGVRPWLPVANDYQTFNVAAEQHDPRSFLMLTRALLDVRRSHPALTLGSYQSVEQENATCFVYLRQYSDQRCLVALNFSEQDQIVTLTGQNQGRVLLSTHLDREGSISLSDIHLRGNEGLLIEVEAPTFLQHLQHLRDLSAEEGRVYIQEHISELSDHAAMGNLLADEALRLLYDPFISLKLADLLIFFGEYVHDTLSHALGLKAKGDVLCYIGHHQAAMACLDAAGREFLQVGNEYEWARSRISWILSCSYLGHVEEALQEAERGRAMFERLQKPYWVCVINHNTAVIYEDVGRYQEALALYERMLAIYPTLTDQDEAFIQRSIALAEMNQALDLALLGRFEDAYRLHEQARASYVALGEMSLVVYSDINLGDLDYTQGYYGSALRRYYRARDTLAQNAIDDPLLLADLKLWMANCLVKLNRTREACQLAEEAVDIYRQSGISLNTGNALREYAITLVASARIEDALSVLDEAKGLFDDGGFEHYAFTTRLQQAELLLEMHAFADAYRQAGLVKEFFDERGLVAYAVRASLVMVGVLLENARNAKEAADMENYGILVQDAILLCKQTVAQARQHNLQVEVYRCHYLLGRLYALEENLERAARHYGAAIAQIERMLHDLAYDLSPSFLHTIWAVYEDMIGLCLQQSQIERAFDFLERARSMALRQYLNRASALEVSAGQQEHTPESRMNSAAALGLQQELKHWQETYRDYNVLLADLDSSVFAAIDREFIESELRRCEAKISELFERIHLHQSETLVPSAAQGRKKRTEKGVDIARLRQQLSSDQLMLAYFLYRGKLVIFAATKERLVTYENADGAEQLERLLPLLQAHLNPMGWPDRANPPLKPIRRLLNRLYELLVAPVAALLPAPSGLLTIVPYGPLHNVPFHALLRDTHYLVEDFQMNYLPTSTLLLHISTQWSERDIRAKGTGTPLVLGYTEDSRLQRVHDEARSVAALLHGECLLDNEATIAHLYEKAAGSPIIHIATHGQIRPDAPNFSYVRLADGQLNAIDAFNLDLKGCELVTLSGCETGLSLAGGGDEQLGLGRAFLAAGAISLVMSLWQVEDTATTALIQSFYQHLLNGNSRVEALRSAQCALLLQTPANFAHPFFWAAFRLVGEVGPLKYNSTGNSETDVLKQ